MADEMAELRLVVLHSKSGALSRYLQQSGRQPEWRQPAFASYGNAVKCPAHQLRRIRGDFNVNSFVSLELAL
eukprot:scaffold126569_cov31-Prasinocladus_malaysianus.AAC.1